MRVRFLAQESNVSIGVELPIDRLRVNCASYCAMLSPFYLVTSGERFSATMTLLFLILLC